MILKNFYVFTLLLSSVLFMQSTIADELNMTPVGNSPSAASVPTHGLSMESVLQRFGEPVSRLPAVGEPPITRWNYPDFTVYFEHQLVIHSVKHR